MTVMTMKLSIKELELLTSLASDQLFRREFIDPRMPGHRMNLEEICLGKELLTRMRGLLDPGMARRTAAGRMVR